jgi:nitroreductase
MVESKEIGGFTHIPYSQNEYEPSEMIKRVNNFYEWLNTRRTVRDISDKPVPKEVIDQLILTASTAPSGAHKQPWTFCAISSAELKTKIRNAAEEEERESYDSRMSDRWLKDLEPIGTNAHKPFLEDAPWIVVVFKKVYEHDETGKHNNYYVNESVGIACGMFITAIHNAGLVTLTHTPSPMNFLTKILDRPANERPFLLLPVGYAKKDALVPDLHRKKLDKISKYYE